ncbi:hypothetical protein FNH13_12110 [Ornithinimicrobium ciconiae]|uniref:Uncharacterized protein n=1 Tax=Ornithinimicrobium ciconiae TaxID=2594265 RepID=A0A516GBR9_9MICO|nr:hypothetical protein [Ornithinimicrobium ciconiae]QDO88975.1 hypothetical protein FNH13_12110 [Ornithinimicrobium ciconiae]
MSRVDDARRRSSPVVTERRHIWGERRHIWGERRHIWGDIFDGELTAEFDEPVDDCAPCLS